MQESGHAWCIHVVGKSNYFQLVPESKIQARVNVIILQHCDLYDISHQNSNHQNSIASDPTFLSEAEQHDIYFSSAVG